MTGHPASDGGGTPAPGTPHPRTPNSGTSVRLDPALAPSSGEPSA
ncbi:hypothetical protein [Saccharothrix lopnurensis]|uniref:Uncharacterized protein n=1 Tax=Saccharothrix lopnurensis TaxID=1670621 RepID=A0ABW1P6X7_9PSEU